MRAFSALSAPFVVLSVAFLFVGTGLGCASMVREPVVEVKATRNALAQERERKTYTLTCTNNLVQQWFLSNPKALLALDAALEKLGYEEAADPLTATYEIAADLGFGARVALQPEENPDSIRFKNVAGMVGQGRYRQILTERDDSGGSLLLGPDGQLIPTGGWKQVVKDSEERESRALGSHDAMILRAWDVQDRAATSAKIFVWEVVVVRTNDNRTPSPEHVGILIRHAAERLAAGWSDESSGPTARSEITSHDPSGSAPAAPSPQTATR